MTAPQGEVETIGDEVVEVEGAVMRMTAPQGEDFVSMPIEAAGAVMRMTAPQGEVFISMPIEVEGPVMRMTAPQGEVEAIAEIEAEGAVMRLTAPQGEAFISMPIEVEGAVMRMTAPQGEVETFQEVEVDVEGAEMRLTAPQAEVETGASIQFTANPYLLRADTAHTVETDGDGGYFVGGQFAKVMPASAWRGGAAIMDVTDPTVCKSLGVHGHVWASFRAADGSIYLGGDFWTVQDVPRWGLAKLSPEGVLDTAWTAPISPAGSVVRSICEDSDGNIIVGGNYSNVGGVARNGLAKLDPDTGAVDLDWDPAPNHTPSLTAPHQSGVLALLADGTDIVVGGSFTNVGGQARNRIAKLSVATGAADGTFDPNANSFVASIVFEPSTNNLLVAGGFSTIDGETGMGRVGRIDKATGLVDASWKPIFNSNIYQLAIVSGAVVVAGEFTTVNATARRYAVTVALNDDTDVWSSGYATLTGGACHAVAVSGSRLMFGGYLPAAPSTPGSERLAVFASGSADTAWAREMDFLANSIFANFEVRNSVYRLMPLDGNEVLVCGYDLSSKADALDRVSVYHVDATGEVSGKIINTASQSPSINYVNVIRRRGDLIDIGGRFTSVNGTARWGFASVHKNTLAVQWASPTGYRRHLNANSANNAQPGEVNDIAYSIGPSNAITHITLCGRWFNSFPVTDLAASGASSRYSRISVTNGASVGDETGTETRYNRGWSVDVVRGSSNYMEQHVGVFTYGFSNSLENAVDALVGTSSGVSGSYGGNVSNGVSYVSPQARRVRRYSTGYTGHPRVVVVGHFTALGRRRGASTWNSVSRNRLALVDVNVQNGGSAGDPVNSVLGWNPNANAAAQGLSLDSLAGWKSGATFALVAGNFTTVSAKARGHMALITGLDSAPYTAVVEDEFDPQATLVGTTGAFADIKILKGEDAETSKVIAVIQTQSVAGAFFGRRGTYAGGQGVVVAPLLTSELDP
jgi:hypothetical protein